MGAFFMWGAYFHMGVYERDVVVALKMGAYIHGCLFCVGAYSPDFTVLWQVNSLWNLVNCLTHIISFSFENSNDCFHL